MRFAKALALSSALLLLISCADESPKKTAIKSPTSGTGTASSDQLCVALSSNAVAMSADYSDFVTELCNNGGLAALRLEGTIYKGSGTPVIKKTDAQSGNSSQMRLSAALMTNGSDAKSYFNMMRVQIDKPTDFDDIYEYDKNINYTRLSGDGTRTMYKYVNKKEDITVEYDATSQFVEVTPSKIYLVTSKADKGYSIVQTFRGLQIINQVSGATEVFSMADQTYDNQGNHANMVSKAETSFREDMARAFRNSLKASEANRFYP